MSNAHSQDIRKVTMCPIVIVAMKSGHKTHTEVSRYRNDILCHSETHPVLCAFAETAQTKASVRSDEAFTAVDTPVHHLLLVRADRTEPL